MQKKMALFIVMSSFFVPVGASVLEGRFDDFLKEVVAVEDQKQFRSFYNELVYAQQKNLASGKKQKSDKSANLRRLGWNALQVRNPELAARLKPDLNNPQKAKQINDFLFRYGAYEEFLKECAAKQNNMLAKTRAYFRDTKNKVVSWVGSKFRRNTVDA